MRSRYSKLSDSDSVISELSEESATLDLNKNFKILFCAKTSLEK
jgi:hypothetical protein